jgi:transcriptional regulator with XRE-family HTH domain
MDRDPRVWVSLGRALRTSRERAGLTAEELGARAGTSGRTVYGWERADGAPDRRKPYKLEAVAAALGWNPGSVDRILNGEDPDRVLAPDAPATASELPARQAMLELLQGVFEFGDAAVAAGADPDLRDQLLLAARNLIAATPGRPPLTKTSVGLVAYRPHGVAEPVPEDDAERIRRAIEED